MSEDEFGQLIANGRDGDNEAIGRLLDQYRKYLLAIANRDLDNLTRQKFAASDIVQESMLTAHQKFAQFRGEDEEQLLAWLRQILKHDLMDAHKRFQATKKRSAERERPLMFKTSLDLSIQDGEKTPGTNAVVGEEARLLDNAMSQLSDEYRDVIRLRSWDELPFEEVGKRMGRSSEAARKLWNRAILQLQKLLDNE